MAPLEFNFGVFFSTCAYKFEPTISKIAMACFQVCVSYCDQFYLDVMLSIV